ncbi:hypothetical protein GOODEAATRI_008642 [Goodea atripinnis]|uniref:Thioredoxin domain containing 16 n=1 Tax=Goodea atripinnis TaxID=208336 RepID=A0ABV0PCI7_9TELE
MWACIAAVLLWIGSAGCTEKANMSNHIEYTAADFYERLLSGKMMFLYFKQQVSPTISLFLVELEKSAEALQDYGVLVGKISCKKEPVQTYCSEAKQQHSAFLFRGGKEFLSFSLDTVFDVNSIVAEVLFAILRDEVKYVHTDADLLAMEKAAKGKKDIVLGYVRSLGTQEHRSLMETAYVYGSKYQFILITGGPVLKQLGVNESSQQSQVWFLHCRVRSTLMTAVTSERCPVTRMRKALSTLNLHTFLLLLEAPLVVNKTRKRWHGYLSSRRMLKKSWVFTFLCLSLSVRSVCRPLLSPTPTVPLPADASGLSLFSPCDRAPGPGHGLHSGLEAARPRSAPAGAQVCRTYWSTSMDLKIHHI